MAGKTFCNVENAAYGDDQFVFGGLGGVTIRTASPHTLDGWAASLVDAAWQVAAQKETADLRASAESTDSRTQDLAILGIGLVLGLALVVGVPRVIDATEKPTDAAGSPALADVASRR